MGWHIYNRRFMQDFKSDMAFARVFADRLQHHVEIISCVGHISSKGLDSRSTCFSLFYVCKYFSKITI
jgi:hypothetical protein